MLILGGLLCAQLAAAAPVVHHNEIEAARAARTAFGEVRALILRDAHWGLDRQTLDRVAAQKMQALRAARMSEAHVWKGATDAVVDALKKNDRWAGIETLQENIVRTTPAANNVTAHRLPGDIAVVKIRRFRGEMFGDVRRMISDLERKRPVRGVVFDLRGNRGGSVREAQRLLSAYFQPGQKLLTTEYGPLGRPNTIEPMNAVAVDRHQPQLPLAVLVDHDSASASELTSGVFKDLGRARIFGEQTYGKGVGQQEHTLADGRIFRQTQWRRQLAGLGYYHGIGIAPDETTQAAGERVSRAARDGLLRDRGDRLMRGALLHVWQQAGAQ